MLFRSTKATLRSRSLGTVGHTESVDSDSHVPGVAKADRRKNRTKKTRPRQKANDSTDLNAIWNELMSMKSVVEDEHDRKLRRIESDLRWTMTLVGGQFLTIIGAAVAMLAGG